MNGLGIAAISHSDLVEVAEVHRRAFPESAITAFGPEAVRRYYQWLLDGPHEAALVGAWQNGRLVGFCAAGTFNGALSGFLRANRVYLALRMLRCPWLVMSPLVRTRVVHGLRVLRRNPPAVSQADAAERRFGILAIATDPSVRGAGAGRALMADAEGRARTLGHKRAVLTVHPSNSRAVRFYEQLGWTRLTSDGRPWSGAMEKQLSSER
jgi:ribosomal protein S18 acetylase RimI-like enzyme